MDNQMNIKDVKSRIRQIKKIANDDPEVAHSLINSLYLDALKYFAVILDNEVAKEVIKVEKINLRW